MLGLQQHTKRDRRRSLGTNVTPAQPTLSGIFTVAVECWVFSSILNGIGVGMIVLPSMLLHLLHLGFLFQLATGRGMRYNLTTAAGPLPSTWLRRVLLSIVCYATKTSQVEGIPFSVGPRTWTIV
jgi:hypothetical protein